MRHLLASTGFGTLAIMMASAASAETAISTATTAPVTTSTLGDIHITSAGSIKPTAAGPIVTVNSSNYVKNEGTLAIQGANGSTGILANPGFTGDITNSGTITIDENYTPTDTDNDGDIDGPFAQGSNRFGIHVVSGGTYTGTIAHSGSITIEGNSSAAIAIDSTLNGSLNATNGKISVLGDNSVGIRTGAVTGNVNVGSGSSIFVQVGNAVGVLIGGDIGGAVTLQGNVSTTGYRYTTAPSDPSKLDSDDLLQGGPAVLISGNVAGGILLDTHPTLSSTNTDVDGDGIADASETTATLVSFGAAPALKIGSTAQDITIGAVAGDGHGLVIKGSVTGAGVYSGITGTGLEIGGTGHATSITGGMTLTGGISATAVGANATAIHIGSGASVPTIANSGSINVSGGGTSTSAARGILIDSGATVNSITNSGTIVATRNGTSGSAAGIVDKSGTVGLVQNSGAIRVSDASTLGDSAIAIDLSANATGAIVRQVAAASGSPAPTITGNILFGSGNDTLDVQAGTVTGKVDFGAGSDAFSLSGTSAFHGTLANSAGVALNVGAGTTLDLQNTGAVNLASLTTGTGATLGVRIGESGYTSYNVAGAASFATGTKIAVTFDQIGTAPGTYTIVSAGTLTGGGNLTSSIVTLPFLFNSTLTPNSTTGQVTLDVQLKAAGELGLNKSESAIVDAVLGAADSDSGVAGVLLTIADSQTLKSTLQQMMPEHAGGVFETVTKPSRLAADILAQPGLSKGLWVQQVAWGSSKSVGDTSSYKLGSWGTVGGYDVPVGPIGSVGVSLGYFFGKDHHDGSELISNHYEAGLYWRGGFGPFHAWARGTAATISFDGTRNFTGLDGLATINRSADARWKGQLYSGSAGISYEAHAGRFSIRPNASIEYYKLHEKGYTETGGGDAYDLTVRARNSNETAADAMLALGYDFMRKDDQDSGWLRLELEGGRRQILSGSVGDTVASFGSGTPFTLTAEDRTSGWRGGLRLLGGGSSVSFFAEANAEQQQGKVSIGGRLGLSLGF
nr:autotransporter domain-containing protein [Sphingomonas sp.]